MLAKSTSFFWMNQSLRTNNNAFLGLPWASLVEKHQFFTRYRIYLQINVTANSEESHRKWVGWVESKLRILIQRLEVTKQLQYIHPHMYQFDNHQRDTLNNAVEVYNSSFFMGLAFKTQDANANVSTILCSVYMRY